MEIIYPAGSVVWVKLEGGRWWPGEVASKSDCPKDVTKNLRKSPVAIVKFFDEEYLHIVKSEHHIHPYNCEKKEEFLKRGKDLKLSGKDSDSLREKFDADVMKAESLCPSPIKPVPDEVSLNANANDSDCSRTGDLFQVTSTSAERFDYSQERRRSSFFSSSFSRDDVGAAKIRKQPSTPKIKETIYTCDTCGYQSVRIDNIVRHHKSHSDPYHFQPSKEAGSPRYTFENVLKCRKNLLKDSRTNKGKTYTRRVHDKTVSSTTVTIIPIPKKRKYKAEDEKSPGAGPKRKKLKTISTGSESHEISDVRTQKNSVNRKLDGKNNENFGVSSSKHGDDKFSAVSSKQKEKTVTTPETTTVAWEDFIKGSNIHSKQSEAEEAYSKASVDCHVEKSAFLENNETCHPSSDLPHNDDSDIENKDISEGPLKLISDSSDDSEDSFVALKSNCGTISKGNSEFLHYSVESEPSKDDDNDLPKQGKYKRNLKGKKRVIETKQDTEFISEEQNVTSSDTIISNELETECNSPDKAATSDVFIETENDIVQPHVNHENRKISSAMALLADWTDDLSNSPEPKVEEFPEHNKTALHDEMQSADNLVDEPEKIIDPQAQMEAAEEPLQMDMIQEDVQMETVQAPVMMECIQKEEQISSVQNDIHIVTEENKMDVEDSADEVQEMPILDQVQISYVPDQIQMASNQVQLQVISVQDQGNTVCLQETRQTEEEQQLENQVEIDSIPEPLRLESDEEPNELESVKETEPEVFEKCVEKPTSSESANMLEHIETVQEQIHVRAVEEAVPMESVQERIHMGAVEAAVPVESIQIKSVEEPIHALPIHLASEKGQIQLDSFQGTVQIVEESVQKNLIHKQEHIESEHLHVEEVQDHLQIETVHEQLPMAEVQEELHIQSLQEHIQVETLQENVHLTTSIDNMQNQIPICEVQEIPVSITDSIHPHEIVVGQSELSTGEIVLEGGGLHPGEIMVGEEIEVQEIEIQAIGEDALQTGEIVIENENEIVMQQMEIPLVEEDTNMLEIPAQNTELKETCISSNDVMQADADPNSVNHQHAFPSETCNTASLADYQVNTENTKPDSKDTRHCMILSDHTSQNIFCETGIVTGRRTEFSLREEHKSSQQDDGASQEIYGVQTSPVVQSTYGHDESTNRDTVS